MRPNQVSSTHTTVEIHPYVQARLRALPRQDETTGILLGSSSGGVTRVTGFKRANPSSMLQAACDAGPALAGFYRLQTPGAATLRPEEEALLRMAQHTGRGLFLLVKAVEGGVEATAWTRSLGGEANMEKLSLDKDERENAPVRPPVLRVRMAEPVISRRLMAGGGILAVAAAAGTFWMQTPPPATSLALDLSVQAKNGELVAAWDQRRTPSTRLESATLSVLDGAAEKTTDLTKTYSPTGQLTLRPHANDVVVTLRVQYAGAPPVTRAATYLGFPPAPTVAAAPPAPPPPPPDAELAVLRRRNKELQDALAALRKHVFE